MFRISVGEFEVGCQDAGLPELIEDYRVRATFTEHFEQTDAFASSTCFVCIGRNQMWPSLVVTQRYAPAGFGFGPGALLVPEYGTLFLGAGTRLLAYDVLRSVRLWEDRTDCGFWSWTRYESVVLLAAELELAAFDLRGAKLWTRFVEPPWTFEIAGSVISLDVMGTKSRLDLRSGKAR